MADKEYICLSNEDHMWQEDELWGCPKCKEYYCPNCGGEVSTITEYDEAMKVNSRERDD